MTRNEARLVAVLGALVAIVTAAMATTFHVKVRGGLMENSEEALIFAAVFVFGLSMIGLGGIGIVRAR